MESLKCIIIDDDPLVTDLVMHFSEKCEDIEFCVSCNDAVEGLKLLSNSHFDLLFLDYNMPALSGKDLLEIKQDKSKVIMITSNKDFAVDSYRYDDVCDYLMKPISYEDFSTAIDRVVTRKVNQSISEKSKESIMVKDGANWVPITFSTIKFIKSESNYCVFATPHGKVMTLAKLKDLNTKLPDNFLRCHRSYIINTEFISQINLEEVKIGEQVIPISALYRDQVKSFIEANA